MTHKNDTELCTRLRQIWASGSRQPCGIWLHADPFRHHTLQCVCVCPLNCTLLAQIWPHADPLHHHALQCVCVCPLNCTLLAQIWAAGGGGLHCRLWLRAVLPLHSPVHARRTQRQEYLPEDDLELHTRGRVRVPCMADLAGEYLHNLNLLFHLVYVWRSATSYSVHKSGLKGRRRCSLTCLSRRPP